ncbi:MAG: hypothetical protein C4B59_13780 [Candidatus Methanogaster sp.]|uniref:Uncharacterized protein n=1 Tax=Candidatus Methanogaster sp. TaxID=3386292 RepID=A0AC61KZI4_9EURY|nr:MAG: hypothetical protein C4B59_13780 [ANME-2 cluster archaeon]
MAEMLDIGYTHEWIRYLMDIFGVPKQFPRPKEGSKYIFCKELFAELRKDESTKEIIVEIAMYIVESERFDRNLQRDGLKHLPVFKNIIKKAGFKAPEDIRQATINSLPECRLDGDIPLWQIS